MTHNMIAILDLGSTQSAQIARDIRALGLYSEIHPNDIAPAALKAELFGAELNAVSAHGLLEHVLEPMIHCRTCEGILEEYAKETGGDLDKAAHEWMKENFDALGAALFAVEQLVSLTADTLQMLPVVQTKEEN